MDQNFEISVNDFTNSMPERDLTQIGLLEQRVEYLEKYIEKLIQNINQLRSLFFQSI